MNQKQPSYLVTTWMKSNKETRSVTAQVFLDWGVKNVIITLGAKGAYYANVKDRSHFLACEVKVVDTTCPG